MIDIKNYYIDFSTASSIISGSIEVSSDLGILVGIPWSKDPFDSSNTAMLDRRKIAINDIPIAGSDDLTMLLTDIRNLNYESFQHTTGLIVRKNDIIQIVEDDDPATLNSPIYYADLKKLP